MKWPELASDSNHQDTTIAEDEPSEDTRAAWLDLPAGHRNNPGRRDRCDSWNGFDSSLIEANHLLLMGNGLLLEFYGILGEFLGSMAMGQAERERGRIIAIHKS